MYDKDDYNGPDDYDGFLHENEKEVMRHNEEGEEMALIFFGSMDWIADHTINN